MATPICRFRVSLSGWTGGPGVNTIYASGGLGTPPADFADTFAQGLGGAYQDLSTLLIDGLTVDIDSEVRVFEAVTGDLLQIVQIAPPDVLEGTGGQTSLSRATHIKLHFQTDQIVKKRMLRGGIYFGPIVGSAIDANGQIPLSVQSQVRSAWQNLTSSSGEDGLGVWHQPRKGQADGQFGWARNVSVMPQPAVLRSRRD